jgi:alkylglycerol monooxygenase
VHHGTNAAYLDKNYAGIFIIWDRLFGTFEEEAEAPLYGTLKPLRSWNPFVANVRPWWSLAQAARGMPTWRDKLRVWWMPPGWHPAEAPLALPQSSQRGYDTTGPQGINAYFVAHLVPIAVLMSGVLTFEATLDASTMLTIAAIIVWTAMAWAGLFECRPWSVFVELARLCCVTIAAAWFLPLAALFVVVVLAAVSARWVWRQRIPLMGKAASGCPAPDPTG